MPSKSKAQARFMAGCAHGMKSDKCPPMEVSKEFNKADTGSKMLSSAMKSKMAYNKRKSYKK